MALAGMQVLAELAVIANQAEVLAQAAAAVAAGAAVIAISAVGLVLTGPLEAAAALAFTDKAVAVLVEVAPVMVVAFPAVLVLEPRMEMPIMAAAVALGRQFIILAPGGDMDVVITEEPEPCGLFGLAALVERHRSLKQTSDLNSGA